MSIGLTVRAAVILKSVPTRSSSREMTLPMQCLIIGAIIILFCACAVESGVRKRRQADFFFPNNFGNSQNRGGFGGHPFLGQFQPPIPQRQPFQPNEFFTPQSRAPFPIPVQPGPPANIDSPQEASTVIPDAMATTPSPAFLTCMMNCPTTSEYNPICATNRQLYFNQQKYDCAVKCGAKIQVWRRGSCEGLFNMMRG